MNTSTILHRLRTTPIKKHDFEYQYHAQTIKYSVWSTDLSAEIKMVVFLGTVQIGKLPAWIAKRCPDGTLVVQGAPHWLARDDGSDIPEFMHRFMEEVFTGVLKMYKTKKIHIIAESQAVPCVLELLAEDSYKTKVGELVLLQPLGLNAAAFAGSTEERINQFKRRISKNLQYQLFSLLSDRRLIYNHRQALRTVGYGNPKSDAQYNVGLMHDSVKDLKKLQAARIRTLVISGKNDMLFPPQEIQATLHKNKLEIPVITMHGVPHSPLATRQGMKLFNEALDYLKVNQ